MTLHLTMNCIIGEAGKRYHRMRVWYTGCATIPEAIDLSDQNGTSRSVPRSQRRSQMSLANADLLSAGVARIISTAAGTLIASDSPFMLITAVNHWPKLLAPLPGLY